MSHTLAVTTCSNLGMELVSAPNQEYQKDINAAFVALGVQNSIWTSGNDEETQNVFKWKGATLPLESYTFANWDPKHPKVQANGTVSYIAMYFLDVGQYKARGYWGSYIDRNTYGAMCVTDLDIFLYGKCYQRKSYLNIIADQSLPQADLQLV